MSNKLPQAKIDEMFAAYLELQSTTGVARKCRVSPATVKRYRTIGQWDERIGDIQEKTRAIQDEKIAERRARSKKIIRAAIAQIGKLIAEGNLEYKAGDLERLIRLDEWLDGLPGRPIFGPLPDTVSGMVEEIMKRTQAGTIDNRTASIMGQLAGHLLRARDQEDLEQRLAALEQKVSGQGGVADGERI